MGIFLGNYSVLVFYHLLGAGHTVHDIIYQNVLNEQIKSRRAGLLSFFAFLPMITNILGILVVGYISDSFGYSAAWILAGLISVVSTWIIYKQSKLDLNF
jgi:MFS family permease